MRSTLIDKVKSSEKFKYLVVGSINTCATYLIYLGFILFTNYKAAYTLAYISGILISYILNSVFVFKSQMNLYSFIRFPFVYLMQYVLGLISLNILVNKVSLPPELAPLFVVMLTIPLGFFLSRYIFKRRAHL